ncbi:MAG: aldehyde dehydrogenase family protein, partial [Burkholderiaceae bacterium]
SRRMPPSLVLDATPAMRVMQEEIFGPILPVVTVDSLDDAIAQVNAGERPLALYWFGRDDAHRDRVLRETISGGVTINDCLWHIGQEAQPFGGVGASGNGAYHGEWGFRAFSKEKPVFIQPRWSGLSMIMPPYGRRFEAVMAMLKRIG